MSARTPNGVADVSAGLTAGAVGRPSNVLGRPGLAIGKLPVQPTGDFTTAVLKWPVPGAVTWQVARSGRLQPRHEKMFMWSAPPARALRRTLCRMIGNSRLNHHRVPSWAEPALPPARST
ncbi:hypothetical protein JOF56_000654 [Kibdelosporangium banguiense]|uniref:Uncharacterized protein n=1 Tax=Kibdelosporangium banguiense TaxID=1365924 RepID=A0ABS4T773_9PSEU|nr:hypothetical protein [Kibdelosporangium banguiense]MBP2320269.1 hypothetical protein [Kibdelosporangium banguiense]